MIDVKQAVSSANSYLNLLQDNIGNLQAIRLEEVELSEDKKYWLITLGHDLFERIKQPLGIPGLPTRENETFTRKYRVFKVNSETGEVEAMKIREV